MNRTPKAQIGIFVVVAILVIVLFIFLLNSNMNFKNQNLKKSSSISKINSQSKLFPLVDNVNFCLSLELKKALIISGARGGFIYNNGEYYSPSINFSKFYNITLISNLNINWNYFSQQVLISGQNNVYIPKINSSLKSKSTGKMIYNNSISTEFKDYILSNFLNCINLKRYKKAGYVIQRDNFSGNIIKVTNGNNIEVNNMKSKIGDKTLLIFEGKYYYGNVIKITKDITYVKLQNPIKFGNIDISKLIVNNLNSSTFIKIKFNKNSVSTSLNFPIKISKGNFSTSFLTSKVSVNSRFKSLLNFGKYIIEHKYGIPAENILNESYLRKISNGISLLGLKVSRTIINNSGNYKLYVYSLIDNQSMLFGTPFVFNFAYEDSAPYLIPKGRPNSNRGNLKFITSVKIKFILNLSKYIRDKEMIGNYFYNCIPNKQQGFSISNNCIINFYSTTKGYYPFKIYLTDGFVKRTQEVSFSTGFGDNKNNTQAKDCFEFSNHNFPFFPLNLVYDSKIFHSTSSQGNEKLFGYFLNNMKNQTPTVITSNLKFSPSCSYNSKQYTIEYQKNNGAWTIFPSSGFNTLNNEKGPININVNIFNKKNKPMVQNNYEITLYPVGCLSPNELNSSSQILFGGSGSCCNLAKVPTNSPPQTQGIINNIRTTGNALNANFYLTYTFGNHYSNFSYTNNNFWKKYGNSATGLYEGKITASCSGTYPGAFANINSIKAISQSNIKTFNVKQIFYNLNNITLKNGLPITLNEINSGGICHFNILKYNADFGIILNNDFALTAGIVKGNILLKNQHLGKIGSNTFDWFKCDSGYVNSNSSNIWSKISIGFGENSYNSKIFVSGKFCAPQSYKCTGNVASPNEQNSSDTLTSCKNTYVSSLTPTFFKTINTLNGTICNQKQIQIYTCSISGNSCSKTNPCASNGGTCTANYINVNETCSSGTCNYP